MKIFESITQPLKLFLAFLLVIFVAGCLGSSSGSGTAITTVSTTAPTISSVYPVSVATGVVLNTTLNATFSESMNPLSITSATFTLVQGTTPVSGSVNYSGTTATFYPTSNLIASTVYTASITTGVTDTFGNALAVTKTWSFTTGTTADLVAPTVLSTVPTNAATGVALNSSVNAIFSKPIDSLTISSSTFTVKQGTTSVAGTVNYSGTTAVFKPSSNLAANTTYTATISTGVKDLAGNALASNDSWSFNTGTTLAVGPAPVNLGTAGTYAVLAETLISATPTAGTAITGNVGISPAAATYIQGFSLTLDPTGCFSTPTPSTLVTGKLYAADYNTNGCPTPANLTTAIGDMLIAYNDAAGRTSPDYTELGAGNISGLILAPGLYKWGTDVVVNSNVTLNGGPNDVWIFQIAGNLTVASATSVLLTGGALPKNIFWQVAGGVGVALGTTSHFEGIILAAKAITLKTNASGNGRLLAQTAVTLDADVVTQPAP
jgi:hypothetical protein